MHCFTSINFDQNRPKIKLFFAKKKQNFWVLGALPPDPRISPPIADFCICIAVVYATALQSLQFTRTIQSLAKDRRDHPSQLSIKYLHYFKCKTKLKGGKRKAPKLSPKLWPLLHACTDVSWLRNVLDSISTWRRCVVFKVGVEFARF